VESYGQAMKSFLNKTEIVEGRDLNSGGTIGSDLGLWNVVSIAFKIDGTALRKSAFIYILFIFILHIY